MSFEAEKKSFLSKKDKSRKGSVDESIREIVGIINSKPDYYTTSSCAGRIMLISPAERKQDVLYLFCSHSPISPEELKPAIAALPIATVFLKQESMILHICCRDIDAAKKMLDLLRKLGLKRAGIISLDNIIIELVGSEHFETLLAVEGHLLVSEDYLVKAILEANKRLERNSRKLELLKKIIGA